MNSNAWNNCWRGLIEDWVVSQMADADAGHGIDHVRRVVSNAVLIGEQEFASMSIVLPAAWLHDCVIVPKNSPLRSQASRMAAEKAIEFLSEIEYPKEFVPPIIHCIHAHSFSAKIACDTLEAKVVQDADRMEAIGAIGIARCLMTGGAMKQRLYDPDEPFPVGRPYQDSVQSVDHFFAKLLGLAATMQTDHGREIAKRRTSFMLQFLHELAEEIGIDRSCLQQALDASSHVR
ncbi:MAG: HD domain-containing protein [Pirellula sp.]|nr:HD domain-containing protein [Pirellula sp.]